MPHLSPIKKVQLAVSCCKGSVPFPEEGQSVYRYKKFRDTALLFGASHRFHSDPFDKHGMWVTDIEDCQVLYEARAMIIMINSAIRKKHLRINKTTDSDLLVTLAEFCRRLLFDEDVSSDAIEVIRLLILMMETNGLGTYTQLFMPNEANVIAGC